MKYEVYLAVSPSNTYYVGITSQGFEVRKSQHFDKAFSNKLQTPFYKALRKYGDEIEWFVIAHDLSKSEACKMEKEYIAKYKELFEVYNVTPGGELPWNTGTKGVCTRSEESIKKQMESRKGYTHSEETRIKISKANKGRKQPEGFQEKWHKSKNVAEFEAYDPTGKFLGVFLNRAKFAKEHNLPNGKISDCLNKKRKHTKGYTFKYINQDN